MLGIVILHILGAGGVLDHTVPGTVNDWVAWFFEICAYCSVDLFGLLTGYLNCEKQKFSSYRLLELLGAMLFYSCGITLVFAILAPQIFSGIGSVVIAIFPMLADLYWYITCYILVFLLMPCLNLILQKLDETVLKKLGILLFLLLSVVPSLVDVDFFRVKQGYSAAWLIVCYIWGGIFRKTGWTLLRRWELPLFLTSSGIVLLLRLLGIHSPFGGESGYMLAYTSPLILLNAVLLLQWGRNSRRDRHGWQKTALLTLSGAAFDVYLLHCHTLIFSHILSGRFAWLAQKQAIVLFTAVPLFAILIYGIGCLSFTIRTFFFRMTRINKAIYGLSRLLDKFLIMEISTSD